MSDYSIVIPYRDYKLMQQAVKNNRYPVEDPSIIGRQYRAEEDGIEVIAEPSVSIIMRQLTPII